MIIDKAKLDERLFSCSGDSRGQRVHAVIFDDFSFRLYGDVLAVTDWGARFEETAFLPSTGVTDIFPDNPPIFEQCSHPERLKGLLNELPCVQRSRRSVLLPLCVRVQWVYSLNPETSNSLSLMLEAPKKEKEEKRLQYRDSLYGSIKDTI